MYLDSYTGPFDTLVLINLLQAKPISKAKLILALALIKTSAIYISKQRCYLLINVYFLVVILCLSLRRLCLMLNSLSYRLWALYVLCLLEDILEYEEDHLDWLETQEYQIKHLGLQNYLQAQVIEGED